MNWPLLLARLENDDSRPEYWIAFSMALLGLAWWLISSAWTRARNLKSSVGRKTGQAAVGFGAALLVVPTALVGLLFVLLWLVQVGLFLVVAAPFWLIARLLQPVPRGETDRRGGAQSAINSRAVSPQTTTRAPSVSTPRSLGRMVRALLPHLLVLSIAVVFLFVGYQIIQSHDPAESARRPDKESKPNADNTGAEQLPAWRVPESEWMPVPKPPIASESDPNIIAPRSTRPQLKVESAPLLTALPNKPEVTVDEPVTIAPQTRYATWETKLVKTQAREETRLDQATLERAEGLKRNGRTQIQASDLENALLDLTEAIRLNPNDAEAYGLRGEAYQKLGRRNDASHDRMQAMELNRQKR